MIDHDDDEHMTGPTPVIDFSNGRSLARKLDLDGAQPSYFGVEPAVATPMKAGDFTGDTRQGGGCNASINTINPHCHGTHTECVGHITDERRDVIDVWPNDLLRARLISVRAVPAAECHDDSLPRASQPDDWIIPAAELEAALGSYHGAFDALIIRTLPNAKEKQVRQYIDSTDYPYLSTTAMQLVDALPVTHFLIDTPSLDRLDDNGALELHRLFWHLPEKARHVDSQTRTDRTVTEMIFVPNDIADGSYVLQLQAARVSGDAVLSNPVLYAMQAAEYD
ncbi:MAG: cyclase family protein [Pseudomonadota bacterium]